MESTYKEYKRIRRKRQEYFASPVDIKLSQSLQIFDHNRKNSDHQSTFDMIEWQKTISCYCPFKLSTSSWNCQTSQLNSSCYCQGRRYSALEEALRTVHHIAHHTCRATLLQLDRAGCRVGSTLSAAFGLCGHDVLSCPNYTR